MNMQQFIGNLCAPFGIGTYDLLAVQACTRRQRPEELFDLILRVATHLDLLLEDLLGAVVADDVPVALFHDL